MSLTQAQEEREYELSVAQMETNIEKLRNDIRYESRKFAVQLVVGAAACLGVGVALANYVNSRPPLPATPAPPPQVIIIPQQALAPSQPAPSTPPAPR